MATFREHRDDYDDANEVAHSLVRHFHAQVGLHATLGSRGDNSFAVDYMQSSVAMREPTVPWKAEPAIRLSVATSFLKPGAIRLWVDGKQVPGYHLPRFSCNVIDLRATPFTMVDSAWGAMFFHLPHSTLLEIAEDLAIGAPSEYRPVVREADPFVAQLTKLLLRQFNEIQLPSTLALDSLGLLLGTHVIQRYGSLQKSVNPIRGGLAAWQKRRAIELLSEHAAGDISIANLARECNLSVSHFARAFKQSLGKPVHRWHAEQRLARARDLLLDKTHSMAAIATLLGFADQTTFSRWFSKSLGMTPNRWRQLNG